LLPQHRHPDQDEGLQVSSRWIGRQAGAQLAMTAQT
jgi:hypothetical protein